jgi:hypothetical protein
MLGCACLVTGDEGCNSAASRAAGRKKNLFFCRQTEKLAILAAGNQRDLETIPVEVTLCETSRHG